MRSWGNSRADESKAEKWEDGLAIYLLVVPYISTGPITIIR